MTSLTVRALAGVTLLTLLGACASVAPPAASRDGSPPTATPAPTAAPPPRPAPSPLAAEQRYLEDWFKGTPVAITGLDDGTLALDVPLAHSFDPGLATVKPALAAVLDRVATSLRRQPGTRLAITAPPDADGPMPLARSRAAKAREHLAGRGIATTRITTAGAPRTGAVHLRIALLAAPITRLDDASLPAPPRPASAPRR